MDRKKLLEIFEENIDIMTDMIFKTTLHLDRPNEYNCKILEAGLKELADMGNPDAAAIYAVITASSECRESFAEDTAMRILFETKAINKYHELIKREYEDCYEEYYNYLYAAPSIWHCETLKKLNESN